MRKGNETRGMKSSSKRHYLGEKLRKGVRRLASFFSFFPPNADGTFKPFIFVYGRATLGWVPPMGMCNVYLVDTALMVPLIVWPFMWLAPFPWRVVIDGSMIWRHKSASSKWDKEIIDFKKGEEYNVAVSAALKSWLDDETTLIQTETSDDGFWLVIGQVSG